MLIVDKMINKVMQGKKAVSPVVATVLLIVVVIILALIIFLWAFRGVIPEAVQKRGMSARQACDEVNLKARYIEASGTLEVTNLGNIPVYRLDIRKKSGGSIEKESYEGGLSPGSSVAEDIGEGYDRVEVIPVILGEVETSKKINPCENSFVAE